MTYSQLVISAHSNPAGALPQFVFVAQGGSETTFLGGVQETQASCADLRDGDCIPYRRIRAHEVDVDGSCLRYQKVGLKPKVLVRPSLAALMPMETRSTSMVSMVPILRFPSTAVLRF